MDTPYIKYEDIAKHLDIKKGDIILLSSNLVKIIFLAKKYEKEFSYIKFIKSFTDIIGGNGTLLIPSYNWDICKEKPYSKN